jgi:transcriptional regulator with XRE-family HTH domain
LAPSELKAARLRLGMTQTELAVALKLGADGDRAVRRWEKGDRPISGPVEVAVIFMLERKFGAAEAASGCRAL